MEELREAWVDGRGGGPSVVGCDEVEEDDAESPEVGVGGRIADAERGKATSECFCGGG